jgi:hypothetical protein
MQVIIAQFIRRLLSRWFGVSGNTAAHERD